MDLVPTSHPAVSWSSLVANALLAASYCTMAVTLTLFARRRPEFQPGRVLWMIDAFLVLGAASHALNVWKVWNEAYTSSAVVELASAIAATATAVVLWPELPRIAGLDRLSGRTQALEAANESLRREVAERNQAEQALRRSEERLDLALRCARIGLWDLNLETGECVYNASWAEMLGYAPGEIEPHQRAWIRMVHPADAPVTMAAYEEHLAGRTADFENEHRLRTKSGTWRWIVSRGRVVEYDAAGRARRMIGVHLDLSEHRRYEEQLREAARSLSLRNAALARTNRELDEFAHVVSHDLKAPIRGISSLATWLADDYGDRLDDQARQYLTLLRGRMKWMSQLVDGILLYARVGSAGSSPGPVATRKIVGEVIEALQPPVAIAVEVDEPLPVVIYDEAQLVQVFQNLIGNAIRHLGRPEGRISISCVEQEADFEFFVRDDGVGIEPAQFERIFRIFQTLHGHQDGESTGIGLAIVKKIVETHGGRVSVESEPDRGSTFHFTVPRTPHGPAQSVWSAEVG